MWFYRQCCADVFGQDHSPEPTAQGESLESGAILNTSSAALGHVLRGFATMKGNQAERNRVSIIRFVIEAIAAAKDLTKPRDESFEAHSIDYSEMRSQIIPLTACVDNRLKAFKNAGCPMDDEKESSIRMRALMEGQRRNECFFRELRCPAAQNLKRGKATENVLTELQPKQSKNTLVLPKLAEDMPKDNWHQRHQTEVIINRIFLSQFCIDHQRFMLFVNRLGRNQGWRRQQLVLACYINILSYLRYYKKTYSFSL